MSAAIASELSVLEKRAKVVDLAKTGMSYSVIAEHVGYASKASVAEQIAAWAAETKPSIEATEELRKLQHAEIRGLREKLYARLDSDEHLAVVDRLVKLMEREARLMGLDMPAAISIGFNLPSAEALAELFADHAEPVIEGTAIELTEGGDGE